MEYQRKLFEKWLNITAGLPDNFDVPRFAKDFPSISSTPNLIGKYMDSTTQDKWEAWQAAAKAKAKAKAKANEVFKHQPAQTKLAEIMDKGMTIESVTLYDEGKGVIVDKHGKVLWL